MQLLCILQNYKRAIKAYFVSFLFSMQKCKRRIQALEKADLDVQKKEKIQKTIEREYVSSEEEGSDDEGQKIFLVKQPRWHSDKVSGIFQKLDEIFETEIQKKRGTDQTIPRKPGPVSDVNMKEQSPINWEV